MRALAAVLAAVACAAVLAACGSGSKTVTQTTVVEQQQAQPQPPPVSQPQNEPAPAPKSSSGGGQAQQFRSPTGNIGCALSDGSARCDINTRDWSPPGRPADCPSDVDFGQGLIVSGSGPAQFVCAGDTALDPSGPALDYGQEAQVGSFSCTSRSDGMTCRNLDTGSGFFISRQRYSTF